MILMVFYNLFKFVEKNAKCKKYTMNRIIKEQNIVLIEKSIIIVMLI